MIGVLKGIFIGTVDSEISSVSVSCFCLSFCVSIHLSLFISILVNLFLNLHSLWIQGFTSHSQSYHTFLSF